MSNKYFKPDVGRVSADILRDVYTIGPSPVTSGAKAATISRPSEKKRYWIDFWGIHLIKLEKIYDYCGFYLGQQAKRYHFDYYGDSFSTRIESASNVVVDEFATYWKIFEATFLSSTLKTATSFLPFGTKSVKNALNRENKLVDKKYYQIIGGPGYEGEGLFQDICDVGRDKILDLTKIILENIERPMARKAAKAIPNVGQIITVYGVIDDIDNYLTRQTHDSPAFELCKKNKVVLEGANFDFYYQFMFLRYYMEQHSAYFYNGYINIIDTYPEIDPQNVYFKGITPYEVDMKLSSGKKEISEYSQFYKNTLTYLKTKYNLRISYDQIGRYYTPKFEEYLKDYSYRLNHIDKLVGVIFHGGLK